MRYRVQRFRTAGPAAIAKFARVTWTAALLAAAPAMAAEVPTAAKAPWQPPVVQAYDWTGLYVGAHLGYAGGRSNWSTSSDLASSLDLNQPSDIFNGSGSYFGGLQIGYDYMLANRVVLGAQQVAKGLLNMAGVLRPTPPSSLNGPIGPHRRWAWASATGPSWVVACCTCAAAFAATFDGGGTDWSERFTSILISIPGWSRQSIE